MKTFDKHLQEVLASNPAAARARAKVLAELPLSTQWP